MKNFNTKSLFLCFVILIIFSSCSLGPAPFTGSKSDGVISVSYTKAPTSISKEEWVNADLEVDRRCQNWGYSKADKFQRTRRVCTAVNAFGCVAYEYYVDYQCVE